MRREVNRDLIRWSTDLHGSRLAGIVALVRCHCNRSRQQQQQEKEKETVRDILSVSMDYVGCGKVTTRGQQKEGGLVGFGHSSVWRCRKRCDVLLAYGRNVATSGKVSLCSFRLDYSCTTTHNTYIHDFFLNDIGGSAVVPSIDFRRNFPSFMFRRQINDGFVLRDPLGLTDRLSLMFLSLFFLPNLFFPRNTTRTCIALAGGTRVKSKLPTRHSQSTRS